MPRRAQSGRWVSSAGLVGLCVSFFLPQVEGFVPAEVIRELLCRSVADVLLVLLFPFYFALAMLVLYALRVFLRGESARRALAHAACAGTLLAFLAYDALCCIPLITPGGLSGANFRAMLSLLSVIVSAGVGTILVGAIWAKCTRPARTAACVAVAGFAFIGYFLYFPGPDSGLTVYPGLWVSLVSSGLLAAGGLFEAVSLWEPTP